MECCSPFLLVVFGQLKTLPSDSHGQEEPRAGRSHLAGCIPAVGERWPRRWSNSLFSSLSPLGITMSFESELACLGSTALAKPGACVRGSGWLRGRCWLVSKGFLSPKNSLITGVKPVPAKHQGGRQHPFLAGCLPPPHPLYPDKVCISSGKKQIVGKTNRWRRCF